MLHNVKTDNNLQRSIETIYDNLAEASLFFKEMIDRNANTICHSLQNGKTLVSFIDDQIQLIIDDAVLMLREAAEEKKKDLLDMLDMPQLQHRITDDIRSLVRG